VHSNQAKGCTSLRESADFLEQILSHTGEIVCVHEIESFLHVNAVDDELRITAIRRPLPVKRDDSPVIIDCAFRAEAANDSESPHLLTRNHPSPKRRRDGVRRIVKCRSTNVYDELMTKPEREIENAPSVRHSSFGHSFGISHSDFVIF